MLQGKSAVCVAFVALIFAAVTSADTNCADDPIVKLGNNAAGIVDYAGYNYEIHYVTSGDGYVINMTRITGKKGVASTCNNREPVIVHHGLLCSAADWLVMNPNQALPFLLVDRGYDVWLPSARGSLLSNTHTTYTKEQVQYWQFSFNEMGQYDVPAMIDYIRANTTKPQVSWVGHSMGCGLFFIGMHHNPTYSAKVRKMVALAPAAGIANAYSPIVITLAKFPQQLLEAGFISLSQGALIDSNMTAIVNNGAANPCSMAGNASTNGCQSILYLIAGFPSDRQFNIGGCNVARTVSHTPTTISYREISHYIQFKQTGTYGTQVNNLQNSNPTTVAALNQIFGPNISPSYFTSVINQYSTRFPTSDKRKKRDLLNNVLGGDGGLLNNTIKSLITNLNIPIPTPSQSTMYDLSKTNMPVLVMCGKSDSLVATADCTNTASKLGGQNNPPPMMFDNIEHLDFTYASDADTLFFIPAMDFLDQGKPAC